MIRIPVAPGGTLAIDVDLGEGLRPDPGFLELTTHDADEIRVVGDVDGWGSWAVAFALDDSARAGRRDRGPRRLRTSKAPGGERTRRGRGDHR